MQYVLLCAATCMLNKEPLQKMTKCVCVCVCEAGAEAISSGTVNCLQLAECSLTKNTWRTAACLITRKHFLEDC